MKLKIILGVVVVVVVLGGMVVKNFVAFAEQEKARDAFGPFIAECLQTELTVDLQDTPSISGRVLTIDVDRKEADYWTFPKLSDHLRAAGPEDVGTVALIRWSEQKVGHYENVETNEKTGEAYKGYATLTLVNWATKTKITEQTFEGDDPAAGLRREGDYTSMQPMFQIVKYLEGLPRR